MTRSGVRAGSLADQILNMLSDAGRGLTLGQIQQFLSDYRELPELSATLSKLEKRGLIEAIPVERTAGRGRRMVKQYNRINTPAGE